MPAGVPNASVLAARARRDSSKGAANVRIEWFTEQVKNKISLTMKQRVKVATKLVETKVIKNISIAVERSGSVVTVRSKPGEYPRADTTLLMKTIISEVKRGGRDVWDGFVGTPLDYGLILELKMNRSFLLRTLNEERGRITRILTGPIRG